MHLNYLFRYLIMFLSFITLEGNESNRLPDSAIMRPHYLLSDFFESFRNLLIDGILFFACLSLAAAVIIILHKIVVEWRTKRFEKLKSRYRHEITELLFSSDFLHLTEVKRPLEFKAASDVAIELMEAFDDPLYLQILHRYLEEYHIRQYYTSLAFRSKSIQRLDAVERIAMFRDDKNRPFFIQLLFNQKNNNEIRISALIGLSYLYKPEDQDIFLSSLKQIDSSGKFSEFLFYNMIERLLSTQHSDAIDSIFAWLLAHQDCLSLKAFIEAVSDSAYTPIVPKLHALYTSTPRDDIKISIIRALGTLSPSEEGCTLFLDALQSDNMVLRIVASKSISICHSEAASTAASNALYDPSYRVRYNVARSLLRLPNGIDLLKTVASDVADRYARQSAAYALRLLETSHA